MTRDDCTGIAGVPEAEAEVLIAALADHVVKPAFIYRHQWGWGICCFGITVRCSIGPCRITTCRCGG